MRVLKRVVENMDFDWTEDVSEFDPYVGMRWKVDEFNHDEIYEVTDIDYTNKTMALVWTNNRGGHQFLDDYDFSSYWSLVDDNRVKVLRNGINESEFDWAERWMEDTPTVGNEYYYDYGMGEPVLIKVLDTRRLRKDTYVMWQILDDSFLEDNKPMFYDEEDGIWDPYDSSHLESFMDNANPVMGDITEDFEWTQDIKIRPKVGEKYIWHGHPWSKTRPSVIEVYKLDNHPYTGVYFRSVKDKLKRDLTNFDIWNRLVNNGTIEPLTMENYLTYMVESFDWVEEVPALDLNSCKWIIETSGRTEWKEVEKYLQSQGWVWGDDSEEADYDGQYHFYFPDDYFDCGEKRMDAANENHFFGHDGFRLSHFKNHKIYKWSEFKNVLLSEDFDWAKDVPEAIDLNKRMKPDEMVNHLINLLSGYDDYDVEGTREYDEYEGKYYVVINIWDLNDGSTFDEWEPYEDETISMNEILTSLGRTCDSHGAEETRLEYCQLYNALVGYEAKS